MKKSILSICSLLLVINVLPAQTAQEALSLSTSNYFLSARQTAMGGASGALFSEMGAIAVNPAILGTYQTSELSFTPLYYNVNSSSNYLENVQSENRRGFVLGSAGIVYSIQPRNSGLRYNMGFSYNRLNNFNVDSYAGGNTLVEQSLWNKLANNMSDYSSRYTTLTENEKLFYGWGDGNTKMFSKTPSGKELEEPGTYTPVVKEGSNVIQNSHIDKVGNVGEYALSFGTNLSDMMNIGVSVVLRDAYLSSVDIIKELDVADTNSHYTYQNRSEVSGLGIGGKIGITITPMAGLNFGVAVHSPMYYSMTRTTETQVSSPPLSTSSNEYKYSTRKESSKYNLLTPLQFVLSASYDIMGRVLLAADYEGVPYTMTNLSTSSGNSLDATNEEIKKTKFASIVRFGAEVPVWQGLSLRGGFGFKTGFDDYNKSSYNASGGIGYRFGEASVDLAYSYLSNKLEYGLYEGAPTSVENTRGTNMINLSLSYRF